jgi:hypothetical protein
VQREAAVGEDDLPSYPGHVDYRNDCLGDVVGFA